LLAFYIFLIYEPKCHLNSINFYKGIFLFFLKVVAKETKTNLIQLTSVMRCVILKKIIKIDKELFLFIYFDNFILKYYTSIYILYLDVRLEFRLKSLFQEQSKSKNT
jgi:hypothetical protein